MMKHRVVCFLLGVLFSFGSILYGAPDQKPREKEPINQSAIVTVIGYDAANNKISQGSGFIIKDDGSVATCFHLVSNANKVKVVKKGGATVVSSGIILSDSARDFAIIQMPGRKLPILQMGDSDVVKKGDSVTLVNTSKSAQEINGTISGVIVLPRAPILIRSSVKTLPENSGTPVVDTKGLVVGMVSVLKSEAVNYEFIVPINTIKTGFASAGKITAFANLSKVNYNETSESFFIKAILSLPENVKTPDSKKNIESSLALFKSAAEKRKDYADAWFYIGYCYGELESNDEALKAFKEAIKIRSEFSEAHFGMGLAAVKLGWNQDAITSFKEAIRIRPEYADAYYNLGLAYINLGWNKEAIDTFKEVVKINPDYAEAYYNLGVVYIQESSNQEAAESFRQAIRINPDQALAQFGLGVSLINMGLNKEATDVFKQAIRINPDYAEAHFGLGVAYLNIDSDLDAIESFKQSIRLKPEDADYSYNLGLAYNKLGMKQEAIDNLKQAVKLQPNYADARFNLGVTYIAMDDRGSALDEYKALKELDPDLADKLFKLIYP